MKNRIAIVLSVGLTLGASGSYASQEGAEPAKYSNVELVSVDPASRLITVRDSRGAKETLRMDDTLGSAGSVKPGDHVIITVRGGLGERRISAITRASATPAAVAAAPAPVTSAAVVAIPAQAANRGAKDSFARQVAQISADARPVDGMWSSFVTSCNAKSSTPADGRPWFGFWVDGAVQADYSTGLCRDLFNQIVATGEGTKKAMASAEDVARKSLNPGEIRDIRKTNQMDWDGWALPAPQKREP